MNVELAINYVNCISNKGQQNYTHIAYKTARDH